MKLNQTMIPVVKRMRRIQMKVMSAEMAVPLEKYRKNIEELCADIC